MPSGRSRSQHPGQLEFCFEVFRCDTDDAVVSVKRYDTGEFTSPTRTPNGYLRCDAKITRVGVFQYKLADGTTRSELRLPTEVFAKDSLASFEDVPLTNNHPREKLTSKNTGRFQTGNVKRVRKHDEYVAANILITDADAIKDAENGKTQLSCGYKCDLEFRSGVTSGIDGVADGQHFDAIQKNIVGNHVAIVTRARAGSETSLHLDTDDAVMVIDTHPLITEPTGTTTGNQTKRKTMPQNTMRIDGVDFEMSEQAAQAVGKIAARLDGVDERFKALEEASSKEKARADKAEEDLVAEKKLREDAAAPDKVQELVKALDKAAKESRPELRVFELTQADNVQVAQTLTQLFSRIRRPDRPEDMVTVTALPQSNAVVVAASKEKMADAERIIKELDSKQVTPQMEFRVYPLANAQPTKVIGQLNSMLAEYRRTRPNEPISITADERTRSVIVTARPTSFAQVEKILQVIDRKPAFETADMIVIPLRKADATVLAAVLGEMLRPSASGQVTPEARALQEQVRRLRLTGGKGDLPALDLAMPIKISSDPDQPGRQGSNSLIVSSSPENLEAMRALIALMDVAPASDDAAIKLICLKNADAESVMKVLQDIFSQSLKALAGKTGTSVAGKAEPTVTEGKALVKPLNVAVDLRTNTLVLSGAPETLKLAEAIVKDLDRDSGQIVTEVRLFRLRDADAARLAPLLREVFTEDGGAAASEAAEGLRTQVTRLVKHLSDGGVLSSEFPKRRPALTIQADAGTNTLVVAARSDVMPLIAEVITGMDIPGAGSMNSVRIFPLTRADATRLATVIDGLYTGANAQLVRVEDRPTVQVDTRTNALVVSASDKTFAMLTALLRRLDVETPIDLRDMRLVQLENADAVALAATIQKMMDARVQRQESLGVKDAEALRMIVVADPRSNSLIVGGSAEGFELVSTLAKQLDGASPAMSGRIQIFTLTNANAGTLAAELVNLFDQRYQAARTPELQRQKPVIVPDLRTNSLLVSANQDDSRMLTALLEKLDRTPTDPAVKLAVLPLVNNDASVVAPMIQQIFQARLAALTASGQPITPENRVDTAADALSNSLIVSASRENLELVRSLLAKLDAEPLIESGTVRLYPLKHSDAERVAGLLSGLISQGLYRPGAAAARNNPLLAAREKIAITADTRTNVLIISASKENFAVIERIITSLDTSDDFGLLGGMRMYTLERADATRLAPTLQQFFDAKRQAEIASGSSGRALAVSIIADARTNTLLVAGSPESFKAAETMIKKLDAEEIVEASEFKVFYLAKATALTLQPTIQELFNQRVVRGQQRDAVTIIADPRSNALIVGASPEDMKVAGELIARLDAGGDKPGESVRVFALVKADAAQVLKTLTDLYAAQGGAAAAGLSLSIDERINAILASGGEADLERIAVIVGRLDQATVTHVTEIRVFALKNAKAEELAELLTATLTNKPKAMTAESPNRQTLMQFIRKIPGGQDLVSQALQEGVLITPDRRANALVVTAPADLMQLLKNLIEALDSVPPRTAQIRAFVLQNADCNQMAVILRDLFRLTGEAAEEAVSYTLVATRPAGGAAATVGSAEQYALTVTVDTRTNTLLIGGTKHHVDLAANVIEELDAKPAQERISVVYRLRNAKASDIETALRNWLDQERQRLVQALGTDNLGAAHRLLEHEVAVVAVTSSTEVGQPATTSNTLLISASPRYFDTIERMIQKLDEPPPQVLIDVLLAEVTLDDTTDIGIDWNLAAMARSGRRTIGTGTRFGVRTDILKPGSGFNFSVTGGDLEFFLRALQSQGRLKVLSRPQILASDNQEATIKVGQEVPIVESSRITDAGSVFNTITYRDVGIILTVTPRISPDGAVKMEVSPEISSIASSSVQISEDLNAVIFNSRSANTTVTVQDGHTIVIGGLITTREDNREDKVPFLGDLPGLGLLFKSTTVVKERTELLIILTPRIIRTTADADRETRKEVRRMHSIGGDAAKMLDAIFNPLKDISPEELKMLDGGSSPVGSRPSGSASIVSETPAGWPRKREQR